MFAQERALAASRPRESPQPLINPPLTELGTGARALSLRPLPLPSTTGLLASSRDRGRGGRGGGSGEMGETGRDKERDRQSQRGRHRIGKLEREDSVGKIE